MSPPIFISVPAGDPALVDELQHELAPYARVSDTTFRDLNTVKLVLEIVGQAVGIAGGVAGILTYLQATRDRARAAGARTDIVLGKLGEPAVWLDDADEAMLKKLLGIE